MPKSPTKPRGFWQPNPPPRGFLRLNPPPLKGWGMGPPWGPHYPPPQGANPSLSPPPEKKIPFQCMVMAPGNASALSGF